MRKKIMTRQLATSVSEDTWRKILEETNEEEVSISSWIREALEKFLDCKNNGSNKRNSL